MTRDAFDAFTPPDRCRFGDNELAPDRAPRPRVTGASDLKDIELALHHETGAAVLVSTGGQLHKPAWVPKSQCQVEKTGRYMSVWNDERRKSAEVVIVTLPEWLAREKGLL